MTNDNEFDDDMVRRHMNWPLSAKVIATINGGGEIATIFKHWKGYPDRCSVLLKDKDKVVEVKFDDLFLIDTDRLNEIPWFVGMYTMNPSNKRRRRPQGH